MSDDVEVSPTSVPTQPVEVAPDAAEAAEPVDFDPSEVWVDESDDDGPSGPNDGNV